VPLPRSWLLANFYKGFSFHSEQKKKA